MCLDDLNCSSQGQGVLWYSKLYFAFELCFLFQQDWEVYGGGEQDGGRSCLREGLATVIQDILERNFGGVVGSAQGQLQVSGTNPSNFIRSWIRPLLDRERGLDFCSRMWMDFRHLNFICSPNSLCLSAIETHFCLISLWASQFSMAVQWLHVLYDWTEDFSTNLTLSKSDSQIFPSSLSLKLRVTTVCLGTLRGIYVCTWVLWLYLHKNWIGEYPPWFRKEKQR